MIVRKRGDWLAAKVGEEILMMSAEQGLYLGLNEVGARIWELIDTESSLETICWLLQEEFSVAPEVCRAEVDSFLDELARHRAIDLDVPAGN